MRATTVALRWLALLAQLGWVGCGDVEGPSSVAAKCQGGADSNRGPRLVAIAGGVFTMGDPRAGAELRFDVSVAPFEMDETEVTIEQYAACLEAGCCVLGDSAPYNSYRTQCDPATDDCSSYPITSVDWFQASAFCDWAGKRLPTEEEWEFAARGPGPEPRPYPWGTEEPGTQLCLSETQISGIPSSLPEELWPYVVSGCPVGAFSPSGDTPEGLHDMAGNAAEWTDSCYDPGAGENCGRVIRGGSFHDAYAENFLSAFRNLYGPTERLYVLGFRCAR